MKVLIFSTAYFPFVGGAEIAIREITERLPETHFDLICAKLDSKLPPIERIGNITVYRIGVGIQLIDKLLVPFRGIFKARELNRENHYNYFWVMMVSFVGGAAYLHNMLYRREKVPVILTLQEGDSEAHLKYRWAGLIDLSWRMALKRTAKLTAISNYLLRRGMELGYRGKSYLIPNGVDAQKFDNPTPHSTGDKITLITTSRLVTKNAVGDVIEALKFLPDNISFQILGTGPLEKELKKKAKQMGVEERVEFVGLVSPEKIPGYLHKADIFIRPSLSEGMGNSFIEAMAAGIPVIATPVGGIPDFLKDGETGMFVEPKNPRQVAFQVQKLISDRVLRDQITIAAKRMVKERYDWDLIAQDMKSKVFKLV